MKQLITLALIFLVVSKSFSQSERFQDLNRLTLLINSVNCSGEYIVNYEKDLFKELKALNWDYENPSTFEKLYQESKYEKLNYRYYLLYAKATSYCMRNSLHKRNASKYLIEYYYKSLFLNLAIENCERSNRLIDSLKYEFTKLYILSTFEDSSFISPEAFKSFALQNIKYCKDLLNRMRLNFTKKDKSDLYYITADGIYQTKYSEKETLENLSEIIKYLSLALREDPANWRALSFRAQLKKDAMEDYNAAIKDYIQLIRMYEAENKESIAKHNKWLKKQNLTAENNKSIAGIIRTYEKMIDLIDCYFSLSDYKNSLLWLDKAMLNIQQYKQYSRYSEDASDYEGLIHYFKAVSLFELNQKLKACVEIEKAINLGYDFEECKKLREDINCLDNSYRSNNITSIPIEFVNGVYEIPISINGVLKLNFIIDEGASDVSISPDVALTLIKSGTVSNKDFIGASTYRFADGTLVKSKVFIIRRIQIGSKVLTNIKASISNSLNAPLLLGQSLLNKFGKFTIDYQLNLIQFED